MAIDRPDRETLEFHCDSCDEFLEYKCDAGEKQPNFVESWQECRSQGWVTMKLGKNWEHYCPKCAADAQNEAAQDRRDARAREDFKERNSRE